MTWVSQILDEKGDQKKKAEETKLKQISDFLSTQEKNIQIIKDTLQEISNQGLTVRLLDENRPVFIYTADKQVRVNRFKQFFYEPWFFRECEEDRWTVDCEPGIRWSISIPNTRPTARIDICLYRGKLIFRSGYKNSVETGSIYSKVEIHPSYNYGLQNKVRYTQYQYIDHEILGSVRSEIDDFYGETSTNNIVPENIINIIHNWFNFASGDI
jgi:hypothetical protein